MPSSTARRRSSWSTTWPGLKGDEDQLLGFSRPAISTPISNIPFLMLTRDFADKLLAAAGEPSLAELEKQIDRI